MTTSKNYGKRGVLNRVGINGLASGVLYWPAELFSQNLSDAIREGRPQNIIDLRQHLLDARKAMDAAECETFIVDYVKGGPMVTDIEGRMFGTRVSVNDRPTDTLVEEARNYLIQEILDGDYVGPWVKVRTPAASKVRVVDGRYEMELLGGELFAIPVSKEHLLMQMHKAIQEHKATEAGIEQRARELYEKHAESLRSWESLGDLGRSGWLYAARQ